MNNVTKTNFVKMIGQGILGAIIGIFSGMILGVLIYFLQFPLVWLSHPSIPNEMMAYGYNYAIWPTAAIPGTLGACFGAIIGSLFGSILSIREIPRNR